MCGIAGVLRLDGAPVDPAALHRMAALLRHRGPDGQGFAAFPADHTASPLLWRDAGRSPAPESLRDAPVGLAHRRLAILDLSETGHQPMSSPDGRSWIVYNGEVYNHAELRAELAGRGVRFRGRSDTEVILAAWEAWGEACLERLEGMFAFGIWDRPGHRLLLARDRFGIKPLYYAEAGGAFGFASEIKPVLSGLGLAPKPRDAAAYDLLVRGLKDHREDTFLEDVLQLQPGCLMAVKARLSKPRPYYDLASRVASARASLPPEREGRDRLLREALEGSVRSHLRSDVATGTCLSGGLDSSAIVGLVARIRGDELAGLGATPGPGAAPGEAGAFHTFSARSEDSALDEGRWIEAVTRSWGLPNHAVRPGAPDFFDTLPDLLWHQEEPIPTGSPYAQWLVMQEASAQGAKVLLDGQGADEILAGYPGMHLHAVADALRGGRWGWAASAWWNYAPGFPKARGLAIAGWLSLRKPTARRWRILERGRDRYLQAGLVQAQAGFDAPPGLRDRFLTERASLLRTTLPSLLHYEDRNSMAHSVETRLPFLDRRVVETCLALPAADLLDTGLTKAALRRAAADALPPELAGRRDKIGFTMADRAWMKAEAGRVRERIEALERAGSPWVDWALARTEMECFTSGPALVPDLPALLLTDLWRAQASSPGWLQPRGAP